MWDVSNFKLFDSQEFLEAVFSRREIDFARIKVINKPWRFTQYGPITFMIPAEKMAEADSLKKALKNILLVDVHVLSLDKEVSLKEQDKQTCEELTILIEQGRKDSELRSEIIRQLELLSMRDPSEKPLKKASVLSTKTIKALYSIAKRYYDIREEVPGESSNSHLEDTLYATFTAAERALIDQCEVWSPYSVVNNRKSARLAKLLSVDEIKSDILGLRHVNSKKQTCLQIAIEKAHHLEVDLLIEALCKVPGLSQQEIERKLNNYLAQTDTTGRDHWMSAVLVCAKSGLIKSIRNHIKSYMDPTTDYEALARLASSVSKLPLPLPPMPTTSHDTHQQAAEGVSREGQPHSSYPHFFTVASGPNAKPDQPVNQSMMSSGDESQVSENIKEIMEQGDIPAEKIDLLMPGMLVLFRQLTVANKQKLSANPEESPNNGAPSPKIFGSNGE